MKNRLKSKLKRIKGPLDRLVWILLYGDTEKVSFFEKKSPELIAGRRRGFLLAKVSYLFRKILDAMREIYIETVREDNVLIPDHFPYDHFRGQYTKQVIGFSYKNCFALLDQPEGQLTLAVPEDICGLYFFVGRQAVGASDGLLKIAISTADFEENIYCKKIGDLNHDWTLYYYSLESGQKRLLNHPLTISWSLNEKGRRVLLTPPVVKRRKTTRTLVILVADALRPQDLGIYSKNKVTPNIDRFFEDGLSFENSFSQSNWTLPTFASMALSRYASDHHVVDPDAFIRTMSRKAPTLAELLRANGFYTYGSVSHRRCNHTLGHHRGFDHFDYAQTVVSRYGAIDLQGPNNLIRQIRQICDYLKNLSGTDFFSFVHFFDTHLPYLQTPGQLIQSHLRLQNSVSDTIDKSFRENLTSEEYDYIHQQYLMKVSELDYHLAELFTLLKNRENCTVLFTSDHGYSFTTHYKNHLDDIEIQTPFLVQSNHFQLRASKNQRMIESSIDLLPTVTSLYKIKDDTPRSGLPLFDEEMSVIPKRYAISELVYLNQYRLKLIGDLGARLMLSTVRDRKSFRLDTENLTLTHHHLGNRSPREYREFVDECFIHAKLNADLKNNIHSYLKAVNFETSS